MGGNLKGILCASIVVVLLASAAMPVLSRTAAPAGGDGHGRALSDVDLFDSYKDYKKAHGGGGGGGGGSKVTVRFTDLANGEVIKDDSVDVWVTATSRTGMITSIVLSINGEIKETSSDSDELLFPWDISDDDEGYNTLEATATDSNGRTGSVSITVTVDRIEDTIDKWAVVIGISEYEGTDHDLQYCDDDALDMYEFLVDMGYDDEHIALLVDDDATGDAIYDAISWMEDNEGADSECVFFYSGHGTTTKDSDGDEGRGDKVDEAIVCWELKGILDDDLVEAFAGFESTKIALIFDSCFSGGMDDLAGTGRVVVTACKETQYSYDGPSSMQNGVFSYYYISALASEGTIEGAYDASADSAHDFIFQYYHAKMDPQLYDGYSGDWAF
jgi:hypothetical protein